MPRSRRNVLRALTAAGIVGIAAVSLQRCDGMPEEAVAPWAGPDPKEPDVRKRLLAWAMLAPNPHNRQSWLADLRQPDRIVLHVATDRLLPETDPFGRQILIGCGTFLELLAIAATAEGLAAKIELLPAGEFPAERLDGRPFASVTLAKDAAVKPDPLFAAIPRRRSNKQPYDAARPITDAEAAVLAAATARPGQVFTVERAPARVDAIRALAKQAWEIEVNTPRTFQESVDLLRLGAGEIARHRDGVHVHGPMIWWGRQLGFVDRAGMARPGSEGHRRALARVNDILPSTAAFGWLVSAANDRASQIESGRAYMRLDLAAAAAGVALHPLSQALQEFPEMDETRGAMDRALGVSAPARAQMLVRLGHAPAAPPTPRRALDTILLRSPA
jgi:hypothetical protein